MDQRSFAVAFRVITIVLIMFGLLYACFGLGVFSDVVSLVPAAVLPRWESSLYGAIMLGWGATLLMIGRAAFRRADDELKRALFAGLAIWLGTEAAASAWLGIWFNVGVDAVVLVLFAVPLLSRPKRP